MESNLFIKWLWTYIHLYRVTFVSWTDSIRTWRWILSISFSYTTVQYNIRAASVRQWGDIYITQQQNVESQTHFFFFFFSSSLITLRRRLSSLDRDSCAQSRIKSISFPIFFQFFFFFFIPSRSFSAIPFHLKWWKVETGNLLAESFFFICRQEELRRCEMNWLIYFPHGRRHIPPPPRFDRKQQDIHWGLIWYEKENWERVWWR